MLNHVLVTHMSSTLIVFQRLEHCMQSNYCLLIVMVTA